MEGDCVSPSAVFPSLLTPPPTKRLGVAKEDRRSVTIDTDDAKRTLRSSSDRDGEQDESSEGSSRHSYEGEQRRKRERRLSTTAVGTGANNRHQPQSESSTSGKSCKIFQ